MESRGDLTRLQELDEKTINAGKNLAELESDLTGDTTVSSTTFESIDSSEYTRTFNHDHEHVKGCAYKYKQCTCELWTRYKMRQEKRKQWSNHQNRELPSNDTLNSTILAGNVGNTPAGTSRGSSDSFHSAQSVSDDVQVVYSNVGSTNNETTTGNLDIAISESKPRDTNHNIDSNQEIELESERPPVASELDDSTSYMMPFLEKLSKELEVDCGSTTNQRTDTLKRLSKSFAMNPAAFADRLLTIIEETNLNSYQQIDDPSGTNLSRLTAEFRKAFKYKFNESMIIDQSMPAEMLSSCIDSSRAVFPEASTSPGVLDASNSPPKRRSSLDFATPRQENQRHVKKIYRKTPKNLGENAKKSNQSPLCIAMLKKASAVSKLSPKTPENIRYIDRSPSHVDSSQKTLTPGIDQSPLDECNAALRGGDRVHGSPFTTPTKTDYNDSFTYWEHYAHKNATPVSEGKIKSLRRSKSVSDMTAQLESARIKRTGAIQYYNLEDSPPCSSANKTSVDNALYDTFNSHPNYDANLPESVLEEVVKKRLRCCETEKMIREIDATYLTADDTPEDDMVLEYLKFVRRSSDYHKYLNKNKDIINKAMSAIEVKRKLSKTPQPSVKTPGKLMRSTKKVQPVMNELKRPAFVVDFRRRSPVAASKTPRGKPPIRSNRGETSLYLRGLSAKKTDLKSESSASSAVRPPTTPRITSRKLALTRSTPNLALTPQSVASKLPPVAGGKTPSRPLSVVKTPGKLNVSRTPAKVNSKSGLTMSSVTGRSKALPPTARSLTKSQSIQSLHSSVAPATPRSQTTICTRDRKLVQSNQKPGVTGVRLPSTPAKSGEKATITYRLGKVFNSPATSEQKTCAFFTTPKPKATPMSSAFAKRGKYFETPVKAGESKKTTMFSASRDKKTLVGSAVYYNYVTVKSPVAEYINSTDAKLVQNVRSKDQQFLLTPNEKKTTTSAENLRIKLGGTGEAKRDLETAENDENVIGQSSKSFPKVVYQPPAGVYDINCSPPAKLRGDRGKVLREINDRRVIIRHNGRLQSNVAEQSIHISKLAEKSNYVGYCQSAKKSFK
ncbi:uncharacterized protein LOC135170213 isoform X2 [Diachasmimorpha longicaudata]|uniref:uncharacterized protein LOC135170213 isoform X2 n=1 Tax=Diachasmimorpha longicaudata TaxID=58733 RepID=UPI0030B8C506